MKSSLDITKRLELLEAKDKFRGLSKPEKVSSKQSEKFKLKLLTGEVKAATPD